MSCLYKRSTSLKFRYNCAPELGLVSFGAGHWHTHLSALEALIYRKDNPNNPNPFIVVFKLHTEARMYMTFLHSTQGQLTPIRITRW